jgi:hypothetical protein
MDAGSSAARILADEIERLTAQLAAQHSALVAAKDALEDAESGFEFSVNHDTTRSLRKIKAALARVNACLPGEAAAKHLETIRDENRI